jgi:hypothetical protein
VAQGRRMRVDTTVVETNIHYPTDSSLLGDGVRVLTRTMKKITGIAGAAGTQLRDRSRSVKWRVLEIARAARARSRRTSPSRSACRCACPPVQPGQPGAGSGESQIGDIGRGFPDRSTGVPRARVRARALLDGKCTQPTASG